MTGAVEAYLAITDAQEATPHVAWLVVDLECKTGGRITVLMELTKAETLTVLTVLGAMNQFANAWHLNRHHNAG